MNIKTPVLWVARNENSTISISEQKPQRAYTKRNKYKIGRWKANYWHGSQMVIKNRNKTRTLFQDIRWTDKPQMYVLIPLAEASEAVKMEVLGQKQESASPFTKCKKCEWMDTNAGGFKVCIKNDQHHCGDGIFQKPCPYYKRERLFSFISWIKLQIIKLLI